MSTTTTPPTTLDLSKSGRVPFARLAKVELRKSYDTRAGFWLLLVTALLTAGAIVVTLLVVLLNDFDVGFDVFTASTGYTSAQLLPVLGILLVTSEWSQRTGMVTFTLEPHRARTIAAKYVAGLALALVVSVVALATAVVVNALYGALSDSGSWSLDNFSIGGFLLSELFAMTIGFALAALLLNTPAAIVIFFVYSWILPAIFAIGAQLLGWFGDLRPWIDFNAAQQPLNSGDMHGNDWAHLVVSGLIWLVLPLALGLWRILRSEVK